MLHRVHVFYCNDTTCKRKLLNDGIGDAMTEGLGFPGEAGIKYGLRVRLGFLHFAICVLVTLFI